jgi:hypothetical protein
MGIEAFAEAALCVLPGWHIKAVEEVNFLAPFKFYRNEPRAVTVEATIRPQGNELVADCRLIGRRALPNQAEPHATAHFTGRVRFTNTTPEMVTVVPPASPTPNAIEADDIYRLYFHGPAYQVLERAWWDGEHMVGLLAKGLPNNHHPSELPTQMAPRLIELCFQTAGLWGIATDGHLGLPNHVGSVCSRLRTLDLPDARLYAVVTPDPVRGTFDAQVVDASGTEYVRLDGYRTIAVPDAASSEQLKALQTMMSLELVAA